MKKEIVILCAKIYNNLPWGGSSRSWTYYHDILGIYISPSCDTYEPPKWVKSWMKKTENRLAVHLFDYLKKNKDVVQEYHRKQIKKKNENSKDGTYYV